MASEVSARKCWTCGHEHDLDDACPRSMSARSAAAAGGSRLFANSAPPPAFAARYDGECSVCDGAIFQGDLIRADGEGGYVHAEAPCHVE
jgi:hypothetical protein